MSDFLLQVHKNNNDIQVTRDVVKLRNVIPNIFILT